MDVDAAASRAPTVAVNVLPCAVAGSFHAHVTFPSARVEAPGSDLAPRCATHVAFAGRMSEPETTLVGSSVHVKRCPARGLVACTEASLITSGSTVTAVVPVLFDEFGSGSFDE